MKENQKNVDYDTSENPEDLEIKQAFKTFSRVLGIIWGICFVILIIIPLLDFAGNQLIVTLSYYFVLIGLIYFLFLEFSFQRMFEYYKKLNKFFKRAD